MMQKTDDMIEIDLKDIFVVLLSKLWLIVLCSIVAGVICFCCSSFVVTPMYRSTTKAYIINKHSGDNVTYSDLQIGTVLTWDYKEMIKSRSVLETVIKNCGLKEKYGSLAGRVYVESISDTRIIAITVEDPDPETAKYLADEIRKVAAKHIKQVMDIEAVNVVDEANIPERPSSPSVLKWTVLGLALGMFACIGVILLIYLLDDTIKTSEDIERYLGLSTLAMIPIMEDEVNVSEKGRSSRKYSMVDSESEDHKPQHEGEVEGLKEAGTGEGEINAEH